MFVKSKWNVVFRVKSFHSYLHPSHDDHPLVHTLPEEKLKYWLSPLPWLSSLSSHKSSSSKSIGVFNKLSATPKAFYKKELETEKGFVCEMFDSVTSLAP